jgi:hypothetical protein
MAYKKIDPAFKTKWTKWLRTPVEKGGYLQVDGTLKTEFDSKYVHASYLDNRGEYDKKALAQFDGQDGFCCLGVACDLIGKGKKKNIWEQKFLQADVNHAKKWATWSGEPVVLAGQGLVPQVLADKIGLSAAAADKLANMNDLGKSFKELAAWIEKHL